MRNIKICASNSNVNGKKFKEILKISNNEDINKQGQIICYSELTPSQLKKIEFVRDSFLELNILELRYLNSVLSEKVIKNTGLSPFKMNIDWPSIKQLQNGTWPPANPNWVLQQEAIAKLWPAGQSGISQLFGSMSGGSNGGSSEGGSTSVSAAATEAAPAAAKPAEEVPKEKQNYDVELAGIDPASKIKIIKEVRSLFNLGLKEAKDLVEKTPCILKQACKKAEAEELQTKLIALGCTVNLV